MKIAILFSFGLLLSCATSIKEEDCYQRNWQDKGEQDGARGLSPSMYQEYMKVCSLPKSTDRHQRYLSGHKTGTQRYCSYKMGLLIGESGRPLPQICNKPLFKDFKRGFKKGLQTKAP